MFLSLKPKPFTSSFNSEKKLYFARLPFHKAILGVPRDHRTSVYLCIKSAVKHHCLAPTVTKKWEGPLAYMKALN